MVERGYVPVEWSKNAMAGGNPPLPKDYDFQDGCGLQ